MPDLRAELTLESGYQKFFVIKRPVNSEVRNPPHLRATPTVAVGHATAGRPASHRDCDRLQGCQSRYWRPRIRVGQSGSPPPRLEPLLKSGWSGTTGWEGSQPGSKRSQGRGLSYRQLAGDTGWGGCRVGPEREAAPRL